jgi:hypothetical protein
MGPRLGVDDVLKTTKFKTVITAQAVTHTM